MLSFSIRSHRLLFGGLLLSSFLLKLRHLGHPALGGVDECCHALVAKNLLKHPFKPTLIDIPYLPYYPGDWGANHVWLHKPILSLWQIAASYSLFGVNTWALRFPSVVLSTGAVWFTYLIGKELLSRRAGLIAAAIQAFSPFLMQLIHGYQFSDAIDISLLFWTELSIFFLVRACRTGQWRYILIAGFGQGCAFLSKSYLALIVTGLALTAWLAPALGMGKSKETRIRGSHVLGLTGVFLLTAAPWTLYTAIRFPDEFHHEHLYTWLHLTTGLEGWDAPWHKLLFNYGIRMYSIFYVPLWVAILALLGRLFSERNVGLTLTYAWGFGVLIPHLLATTKTPSATVIGMPAFLLLFGELTAHGWSRARWELGMLSGALLVGLSFLVDVLWRGNLGIYVIGSLGVSLGAGFALWALLRWDFFFRVCIGTTFACLIVCSVQTVWDSWEVTRRNRSTRTLSAIAVFAQTRLPENAVLLVDIDLKERRNMDDHLRLMFLMDKTAHSFHEPSAWQEKARQVRAAGGVPYLVSFRPQNLPVVFSSQADERTIYQCPSEE